ncbi:MAG: cation:proton antiporter [Rhizobacter sp.]|nr:cation:proton antiporter [Bacteriovorax sp.]
MNHLPDLIRDLGFILITAAVVTLIFKRFKQPLVLGYLMAGFFLSQHFPFFIGVQDTQSITIWAEIGVIFLLFGLGLEFSFKKLSRVGKSAGITAFVESAFMLGLGYITGKLIGWNNIDSIYLGGILSISSTTIIVRAFDELDLKGKKFVSLVFGVLIVEDLIAILLLVLLTTIAVTNSLSGAALATATFKLGFFLTLWFLVGIYIIPILLNFIRKLLTPETTVVVSLALCLMMVIIATDVGFSAPLGAFIMGSILAETREGKKIEHLLNPIKDLFAAVFFVSVGMMINPAMLYKYSGIIFLITVITILGKIISSTIGALLSGQSLKTSMYAGMSLAQIGEFSFIIATLGMTLKVTSDFLYPIAVAVSAITTFTTPYLIKNANFFYEFINKRIPHSFHERLAHYESTFSTKSEIGLSGLLWKAYGIRILLNITVVVGVALFTENVLLTYVYDWNTVSRDIPGIGAIIAIIISAPFLWAIVFGSPAQSTTTNPVSAARLRGLLVGVTVTRIILGIAVVLGLISRFTTMHSAYLIALIVIVIATIVFRKSIEPFYRSIEERFMYNLNEKEREELALQKTKPQLAPWDAVMTEFIVSPDSLINGKTLQESELKEKFGVTIALIERGNKKIMAPGRDTQLMSFDRLFLIGTDSELGGAKKIIETAEFLLELPEHANYGLESFTLSMNSPYIEKSIRDCGLRENIEGLIVGLEREGARYLNPDSGMILKAGDLLWIVANIKHVNRNLNV